MLIENQTADESKEYVRVLEITVRHCEVSKCDTTSTWISGHLGQL